jgi:hypothetical protein
MKHHALLVLILIAIFSQVRADDRSHREVAAKVVALVAGPETIRAGFYTVIDPMLDGMRKQGASAEFISDMRKAYDEWLSEDIKWSELSPLMEELYVKEFSESELTELHAFYCTPLGRKMMAQMPALMQKGALIGQTYAQSKQASLEQKIQAVQQKHQASGKSQ